MSKVKKRQYVFLSSWTEQDLKCVCLFNNPCCANVPKSCEKIEFTLSPYDDIGECMRTRRYERTKGALRQK